MKREIFLKIFSKILWDLLKNFEKFIMFENCKKLLGKFLESFSQTAKDFKIISEKF